MHLCILGYCVCDHSITQSFSVIKSFLILKIKNSAGFSTSKPFPMVITIIVFPTLSEAAKPVVDVF